LPHEKNTFYLGYVALACMFIMYLQDQYRSVFAKNIAEGSNNWWVGN